jgi:uncharacterized protein
MKRNLEKDLINWKNQERRMPLILRGARQVGKTYLIENFGKNHFEKFISINLEVNPKFKSFFKSLYPSEIIKRIEIHFKQKVIIGKTLLFIDEIQECPKAITALRYFKEKMPELHVITAGSLLEFAFNAEDFSMPVGRVQFMYLRPLSFSEFLNASKNHLLKDHLKSVDLENPVYESAHNQALSLVREYFALGGMPAVLSEYFKSHDLLIIQNIQTSILSTFRNDFGKYAKRTPVQHLETIFSKGPTLIGKWLKYSTLDPNVTTPTLKKALSKLCKAGLFILIYSTSGIGLPLITHSNEKKFKFLFLDTGLVQRECDLDLELLLDEDLLLLNNGALAEQFVGQELLAYFCKDDINKLYSWHRDKKGSSAEIDFLTSFKSIITPIEVKAGKTGSLKSLLFFMKEKKAKIGVQICASPLSFKNNILTIPFYLIEELPRLIKSILAQN